MCVCVVYYPMIKIEIGFDLTLNLIHVHIENHIRSQISVMNSSFYPFL